MLVNIKYGVFLQSIGQLHDHKCVILCLSYAPINGLPQDGGEGHPREFDFVKLYPGRDFDIHNGPLAG